MINAISVGVALLVVLIGWVVEQRKKSTSWSEIYIRARNGTKLAFGAVLVAVMVVASAFAAYQHFFAEQWLQASYAYWDRGARSHLVLYSLTFKNTSTNLAISDPLLTCKAVGHSGTTIESVSTTVFERIRPKSSVTVPRIELGSIKDQTSNVTCDVTDASSEVFQAR